jgi:hypothetical protein
MGNGNVLAEADGSGNLTAEYIYFNGKRIARIDLPANTVHYYMSDHLGSTSKVITSAGVVEEESDFTPYGSELTAAQGTNHYKFTGKEREQRPDWIILAQGITPIWLGDSSRRTGPRKPWRCHMQSLPIRSRSIYTRM